MTSELMPTPHPHWVETWSGEAFDLMLPDPRRFHIEDVAVHLSLVNRFNGATGEGYSVAQHCVHVAELVPPEFRRRALLHDVEEFVTGDMVSPWKRLLKATPGCTVSYYTEKIRRAAAEAFHTPFPFNVKEVYEADLVMRSAEIRDFMHARRKPRQEWAAGTLRDCSHVPKLTAWPAALARARFLEVFDATGGGQ